LTIERMEDRFLLSAGLSTIGTLDDLTSGRIEMSVASIGPEPPIATTSSVVDVEQLSMSSVMLSEVPTSTWTYGCTATSAGMLMGYYDRHGYPNMYIGPANGGVAPLTNLGQGDVPASPIAGACSIIATQNGFDGRATKGHVDDYWTGYGNAGPDPWEGHWTEHTWGECTADYLGTNQWKWDTNADGTKDFNTDGSTVYFSYNSNSKLYDYIPPASYGLPQTEACHGLKLFAQSRGYTVTENYTQKIDTLYAGGFSFADLQTEINAGRPVLIHVTNHTMIAVGYDTSGNTMYLHDTWDNSVHSMTWGGSYSGLAQQAMTVLKLADATPPQAVLTASNVVSQGAASYTFTVTYSDNTAVDVSTLDSSDIRVTGPNSFNQVATFVSVDNNTDGTPRVATYQLTPPGGSWDYLDNGTYTVSVESGQVTDTGNNAVAAAALGTFAVDIVGTGSISGLTFNDLDRDGAKDAAEPVLSGWTIQLDLDNNGSVDRTTITDPTGNYAFADVPAGTHQVSEVLQTGWRQTCPGTPGTYTANVEAGANLTGRDFGARLPNWTVMVYLDADNNLEANGLGDFLEMATVGSNADLNIVVQFDRTASFATGYGDWADTRRGLVSTGSVPDTSWGTSIGEANMGDPNTLLSFVDWATGDYPALNYALVLWDHGSGWRSGDKGTSSDKLLFKGACWDDTNSGDYLENREVGSALASIPENIDLFGYDCCLMAMLECAHEVAEEASVFVTSEKNEPGDGWPYDTVLADLQSHPDWTATELGADIVTRYGESYAGAETQSATNLGVVNALSGAVSDLASAIIANARFSDYLRLQSHREAAVGSDESDFRDLGTFLSGVAADASIVAPIRSAALAASSAYQAAIIQNHSQAGLSATGLSIYFPEPGTAPNSAYNSNILDFAADTQWDEFLAWWTNGVAIQPGQIAGLAWNDLNANRTQDGGETGLAGRTVFCDNNLNGVVDTNVASSPATGAINLAIPDETTTTSELVVSGVTGQITDLNLTLNITHTYDRDLKVYLISPQGVRRLLLDSVGGNGDNFTSTVLDDEASTAIGAGSAPFTGSYRPTSSLAVFDGLLANGTWQLQVVDQVVGDVGTLVSWSLAMTTSEAAVATSSDGSYSLTGLLPGDYRVVVLGQVSWLQTYPTAPSYHSVSLVEGQTVAGRAFGLYHDGTAPQYVALLPADGAADVAFDATFTITFSEAVRIGAGNVTLKKRFDGSIAETIAVGDPARVSISGTEVTIDPANLLLDFTKYYIEIDAGAFTDVAGNAFAGISGTDTWNFTTRIAGSLDVDGNGSCDALTDGILILRYLFAPTGDWVFADALGPGATRTTREELRAFMNGYRTTVLDVDGNGSYDALTDGILILRYLFAPSGDWVIADAIGPGAARTTRDEIRAFLDPFAGHGAATMLAMASDAATTTSTLRAAPADAVAVESDSLPTGQETVVDEALTVPPIKPVLNVSSGSRPETQAGPSADAPSLPADTACAQAVDAVLVDSNSTTAFDRQLLAACAWLHGRTTDASHEATDQFHDDFAEDWWPAHLAVPLRRRL
jgi:subtilisin-like proprotein convertase family protein